jgi:beta-galactosidase/beta-glucuronidase
LNTILNLNQSEAGVGARPWYPAAAPLMTRWAKDVSPSSARPEYPRPQMVRRHWRTLNGLWDLAFGDEEYSEQVLVPFTFEAALSGLGRGEEVHEQIRYRRFFSIPKAWTGKRVRLNFGAVDWEAKVFVNGQLAGSHRGGYTPFSFDITDFLKEEGEQELVVEVYDPAAHDPHAFGMEARAQSAYQPMGKQLGSVGIWYTRATGIWQTVWLEPVAAAHVQSFRLQPDLETGRLTAAVRSTGGESVGIRVFRHGRLVASAKSVRAGHDETILELTVADPEAWSPDNPALYDVTITLLEGRRQLDQVRTYTAFRSVGMQDGRITLNGEPFMLRGVLDQGYWPDGVYTAPTEEALLNDILQAKRMGFNLARKHAKIEEARWYYLCDKHGLLVAQDMPSSQDLSTAEAKQNYRHEWREVMDTLQNHPCVIMWIPFNENWGNPGEFQDEIALYTMARDSSRLLIDASGWTQRGETQIIDHHDYTNNLAKHAKENPEKPQWFGEYGGIAFPVEGHTWMKWWGYQSVKSASRLLGKVKFLTRQITEGAGFSGFCYTQLSDVEQELNGLMTYDRIPKAPVEKIAEIFKA